MTPQPIRLHGALIQPLRWIREPGILEHHEARTPFGVYRVMKGREGPIRVTLGAGLSMASPSNPLPGAQGRSLATIAEAMGVAEADYEAKVLGLLVAPPAAATGSGDLVMRLRRQPEDEGGPSRMDMLRERLEAADEIEKLRRRLLVAA